MVGPIASGSGFGHCKLWGDRRALQVLSIGILRLHPRRSGATMQAAEFRSRICNDVAVTSQKISMTVDDELSVRKFINSVLPSDGFKTIEKADENSMVILLVEDDVHVQYFVWKLLKADGFTVLTAGNGEFALEASRSHCGPIDLLLTDIEMPRMNGLELCRNIKPERPGIKVLVMSGDLREREQDSVNGLPFLQKPFTPTVLRDSIEALLGPLPSMAGIHPRSSETTLTARSSQGRG
jgi:CheY-like chemotaxis protein